MPLTMTNLFCSIFRSQYSIYSDVSEWRLRAGKACTGFVLQCSPAHCVSHAFLVGLMESMRQADLKNWSLDQVQFADLCSSLNQFFTQTGLIHSQSNVPQNVCHGAMHPAKPSQHIGAGMGLVNFHELTVTGDSQFGVSLRGTFMYTVLFLRNEWW